MPRREKDSSINIDPALIRGDSALRHSLLVAMPQLDDSTFVRSVIYICAHSDVGAMGIVLNQRFPDMGFDDLLEQLGIAKPRLSIGPVVRLGGPVDTSRGFVLHSDDYVRQDTVQISDTLCLTGTVDILRAIAEDRGPDRRLFAMGYAGWSAGQLEKEIQENSWLTVPSDNDLLFGEDLSGKWEKALDKIGITPLSLSLEAGRA